MRSALASADVALPAERAFAFLADLGNHWRLASRWIEVVELRPATGPAEGATVILSGPFGMSRTVHTTVQSTDPPCAIRGHGRSGRTHADVAWRLDDRGDRGDRVRVAVEVTLVRAELRDRIVWSAGGRRWLAARLAQTLADLEASVAGAR